MSRLYTTLLSANGRKALAIVNAMENLFECEIIEVNVYKGEGQTPEYLKINPFGKIPTFVNEEITLFESNAILNYIGSKYSERELIPKLEKDKAVVLQFLFWESSHWQPTLNTVMRETVTQKLFPQNSKKEATETDWTNPTLVVLLNYLEALLSQQNYMVGSKISIADISIGGMTTYFEACGFPFDKYPSIKNWYDRLNSFEFWSSTIHPIWNDEP